MTNFLDASFNLKITVNFHSTLFYLTSIVIENKVIDSSSLSLSLETRVFQWFVLERILSLTISQINNMIWYDPKRASPRINGSKVGWREWLDWKRTWLLAWEMKTITINPGSPISTHFASCNIKRKKNMENLASQTKKKNALIKN